MRRELRESPRACVAEWGLCFTAAETVRLNLPLAAANTAELSCFELGFILDGVLRPCLDFTQGRSGDLAYIRNRVLEEPDQLGDGVLGRGADCTQGMCGGPSHCDGLVTELGY